MRTASSKWRSRRFPAGSRGDDGTTSDQPPAGQSIASAIAQRGCSLPSSGPPSRASLVALTPVNALLARVMAARAVPGSVLHVSALVHVPYYTVRILREHGVTADYFAVGDSPWWNKADFTTGPAVWRWSRFLRRCGGSGPSSAATRSCTLISWHGQSRGGWEWPLLSRMGRTIVVHYRGCEIRNREVNQRLHPGMNICQECDYQPRLCATPLNTHRRGLAIAGNAFLVTTPDMKDFVPEAVHMPFFDLARSASSRPSRRPTGQFKIVHATNHPGIEGTRHIRQAIEALIARGWKIDFVELRGVTHDRVLHELADADLAIGKMKMGYYANVQVESLPAGVPAVTFVRDDLMTDDPHFGTHLRDARNARGRDRALSRPPRGLGCQAGGRAREHPQAPRQCRHCARAHRDLPGAWRQPAAGMTWSTA